MPAAGKSNKAFALLSLSRAWSPAGSIMGKLNEALANNGPGVCYSALAIREKPPVSKPSYQRVAIKFESGAEKHLHRFTASD